MLSPTAHRARVLAVTSGKGGVGKSNFTVNLALAFRRRGREVLLFDADLGLSNADLLLGLIPPYNLGHVRRGEKTVGDIVFRDPNGLQVITGGSGIPDLVDLDQAALTRILEGLLELEVHTDLVLVDTGAGIGRQVLSFVLAADEVLVVTTPEPTALTDAYATIKEILRHSPEANVRVVINRVRNQNEGRETGERLLATVRRFLQRDVDILGYLPDDPVVSRAVHQQKPFLLSYPGSSVSRSLEQVAATLEGEKKDVKGLGGFFRGLWSHYQHAP